MSTRAYCKWCETPLSPAHTGPCPNCGKTGKKSEVSVSEIITLRSSYSLETRGEFFEENPLIRWFLLILDFVFPLFGYFLGGYIGVIIGLFISIISELLSPYAIVKVREITRTRGD